MTAMPPYPVICYKPGCANPARFKIAARWSDGTTYELKTYFLACDDCVTELLPLAKAKRTACRLTIGETLDEPAVYELRPVIRNPVK